MALASEYQPARNSATRWLAFLFLSPFFFLVWRRSHASGACPSLGERPSRVSVRESLQTGKKRSLLRRRPSLFLPLFADVSSARLRGGGGGLRHFPRPLKPPVRRAGKGGGGGGSSTNQVYLALCIGMFLRAHERGVVSRNRLALVRLCGRRWEMNSRPLDFRRSCQASPYSRAARDLA
jgi:hypothetical protein